MNELQQQILNNFHNDIKEFIKGKLDPQYLSETYDIQFSSGLPKEDRHYSELLGIYYLFRRRFPRGFKQVMWSRELLQNPLFHKYRKNLNKITAAINTGRGIREYLPDDIGNLRRCTFIDSKADHLLTGWGITHLHIFTRAEREELEKGGRNDDKFLLYVLSIKDKIFFIDLQDHCSMTSTNLLNIINTNLTGSALIGFMNIKAPLSPQSISPSEIRDLRKMGTGFALNLNQNGDIFMSNVLKTDWWCICEHINAQLRGFANCCAEHYTCLLQDICANIPEYAPSDTIDIHIGFGEGKKLCNRYLDDVFIYTKYDETSNCVLDFQDNQPIKTVANILKLYDII